MTAEWKERLSGLLSRKFLAFGVASIALFMKLIDGWMWLTVAGVYLGANLLQKKMANTKDEIMVQLQKDDV